MPGHAPTRPWAFLISSNSTTENGLQRTCTREATGRCFIAGPNWGEFYYSCKFCIPGASRVFAANSGRFAGLALASLGNAVHNVNSMRYGVVLGHAPNEGTWSIGYGGAQPQTPIRLGAEFPVNGTDVMQLDLD